MSATLKSDLDADQLIVPDNMPTSLAPQLRLAAAEYRAALKPAGPEFVERCLMRLRTRSQSRRESEAEFQLALAGLKAELAPLPRDLVADACRRQSQIDRFFPRSPSELLRFAAPAAAARLRYASRFDRIAETLEARAAEARRLAAPPEPVPDHELIAMTPSMRTTMLARGWITPEQHARVTEIVAQSTAQPMPDAPTVTTTPEPAPIPLLASRHRRIRMAMEGQ